KVGGEQIALPILPQRLEREVPFHRLARPGRHLMHALEEKTLPSLAHEDQFDTHRSLAGLHERADRLEVFYPAEEGVLDGIEQAGLAHIVAAFDEIHPRLKGEGGLLVAPEVAEPYPFDHGTSAGLLDWGGLVCSEGSRPRSARLISSPTLAAPPASSAVISS